MKLESVKHAADGSVMLRYEGDVVGTYRPFRTRIDALLGRVEDEYRLKRARSGRSLSGLPSQLGIAHASISRCRAGKYGLPQEWLLRMHDYSGIPIEELRKIANLEPLVTRRLKKGV